MAFVIALGMFLMILPQNLLSTISSAEFVTYMGIGDGEIRLDLRQTEDIALQSERVEKLLAEDAGTERFAVLRTYSCRTVLPEGGSAALQVEQGDHTVFPVSYAKGQAPKEKDEIALSCLLAEELGFDLGDTLLLFMGDTQQEYRVCGIYSDITNGGKTAKAAFLPGGGAPMWSIFYVSLKEGIQKEQWLRNWTQRLSDSGIRARAVDIQEYVAETYGQTIREIRMAAWAAVLAAVLVMFVVVVLFTRLLVSEERNDISLGKALGFTGKEIRNAYFLRYLPVLLTGVLTGILSGNLLGQQLAGLLLKSLGAAGFRFLIDGRAVFGWIPGVTVVTVAAAILLGLLEIGHIRAFECCMGKE